MQKLQWPKLVEKRNHEVLLVVIDTNVLISYLWGSKNAETLVELLFTGKIQSVVTEKSILELSTVGDRGKFKARFSRDVFNTLCDAYQDISLVVILKKKLQQVLIRKTMYFLNVLSKQRLIIL